LNSGWGGAFLPIEVGFYGAVPAKGSQQFAEALEVIKKGLTSDILNHQGEFYHFNNVPIVMHPGATAASTALVRSQESRNDDLDRGERRERRHTPAGGGGAGYY
jgi:alkanesulfonate monooxygenase SsuD/methylene tetrahydromethanopterin reductase-like flavin-dependent oxidoreductase (luciferase family)